jgi:hypothetical protein
MLDAALRLARSGFRVFPLPVGQKAAKLAGWQKKATTDAAQVGHWWGAAPQANIAIVTGGDLFVLDEDPRHGSAESMAALELAYGELPETLTACTPSGGRHRFFRAPREVPNSVAKVGPGLDIRGRAGYVVASPSTLVAGEKQSAGSYGWENRASIANAPEWLIELACGDRSARTAAPSEPAGPVAPAPSAFPPLTAADVRSALAALPPPEAGERDRWRDIGFAVKDWERTTGANPGTGFELWDEWCARASSGYDAASQAAQWDSFDSTAQDKRVTAASLVHLAATCGWVPPWQRPAEPEDFPIDAVSQAAAEADAEAAAQPAERSARLQSRAVKMFHLMTNEKGKPLSNTLNAERCVKGLLHGALTYDEFLDRMMIHWPGDAAAREWRDDDTTRLQVWLQGLGLSTLGPQHVYDAAQMYARAHSSNVLVDWLLGLKWDGTRRLSTWLQRAFGVPPSRYHVRTGRNWLIAMVARAMKPGCMVKLVPVLEGPQDTLKSSAFRALAGDRFRELIERSNSKDFEQQLNGVWLGEFCELATIKREDDIERVKQFISNDIDHYRPSYGRAVVDRPRRIVFVGTTNSSNYLRDNTGNVRFFPIKVGQVDLQWIRDNREQMFAEAVMLYQARRKWWIWPKAEAAAEQEARQERDPWEARTEAYLRGRSEIEPADLLDFAVGVPVHQQTRSHLTRAGIICRKLGCTQRGRHRADGGRFVNPWVVPDWLSGQERTRPGPISESPPDEAELEPIEKQTAPPPTAVRAALLATHPALEGLL